MSRVLLLIALIAFIVGAVFAIFTEPDPLNLWAALFIGLACWVAAHFAPRDLPG